MGKQMHTVLVALLGSWQRHGKTGVLTALLLWAAAWGLWLFPGLRLEAVGTTAQMLSPGAQCSLDKQPLKRLAPSEFQCPRKSMRSPRGVTALIWVLETRS